MPRGSPLSITTLNDDDAVVAQSLGIHLVIFLVTMQQKSCIIYARYLSMVFAHALVK